tara:strand:- start:1187 stop:1402 length:216 start_codon:yes stop_codon:yes gene_type:complete
MTLSIGKGHRDTVARMAKAVTSNRAKIKEGMPNSKKMKNGQVIFCKIKEDIYQVIKVKGELYRQKYEKVEF